MKKDLVVVVVDRYWGDSRIFDC